MKTSSGRTVRVSDSTLAVMDAICARFGVTQKQAVSVAVHELWRLYKDAETIPLYADPEGEHSRPLSKAGNPARSNIAVRGLAKK